jgi:hypothetical protein
VSTLGTVKASIFPYIGTSGTIKYSNRTTIIFGGTKNPHSAMLGGHSTLNTVFEYGGHTLRFSDGPYECNVLKFRWALKFYG